MNKIDMPPEGSAYESESSTSQRETVMTFAGKNREPGVFEHDEAEVDSESLLGQSATLHEVVDISQIDKWNDCGYTLEKFGNDPSVIMLGEFHSDAKIKEKQIELIRILKPQYVLYEPLNGWLYDPVNKIMTKQTEREFAEGYEDAHFIEDRDSSQTEMILQDQKRSVKSLINAADEYDFTIIGCDLTLAEQKKAGEEIAKKHPDKYVYSGGCLQKKDDPHYVFLGIDPEYTEARERFMEKMIIEYQRRSKKPIVVILGAVHCRNIHEHQKLQNDSFGYVFVDQTRRDSK